MPVNFLTATQRERYCNYPDELSPDEIARHFHLDDADLVWIATKRRDSSRLGYALQLSTVRFLGAFLDDPTAVPTPVLKAIAKQIGVPIQRALRPMPKANSVGATQRKFGNSKSIWSFLQKA